MSYIDLVWTGMAAMGGLLVIERLTDCKTKLGAWLIFGAYMLQVYWEFTHPWKWPDSLSSVIDVSIIIIFGFALAFRRQLVKSFPKSLRKPKGLLK